MNKIILEDDNYCFACGENNPQGLKLNFQLENNTLKTKFKFSKIYQGYKNIVHGGIIGLILDEVMVNLCLKLGYEAVSAEVNYRLKKPCFVGEEVEFKAWIKELKLPIIYTEAEAVRKYDLIARAWAKCKIIEEV
jgi:acyl-coenzyme A thioesterase PaaI-like protein